MYGARGKKDRLRNTDGNLLPRAQELAEQAGSEWTPARAAELADGVKRGQA